MTQVRIHILLGALVALMMLTYTLSARPSRPEQERAHGNTAEVSALNPPNDQASAAGGVAPAPGPVTLAPTDPLVQRRNANARAAADYNASKKASEQQMQAAVKNAKEQYKEGVANAKINRKADRDAATNELKASEPERTRNTHVEH